MLAERYRTALTIGLLTLTSVAAKLLGFVREQVIAGKFGVTALTDAYIAAQVLPITLDTIIGAAIASILVPQLTAALEESRENFKSLLYSVLFTLGAFYALEAILLILGAPYTMRFLMPGLAEETMVRSARLAAIFAPTVALNGLLGMISALLNVSRRFLIPGIAALLPNLFLVVGTWLYWEKVTPEWMASTLVLGLATQLGLLVLDTKRLGLRGVSWRFDGQRVKHLLLAFLPLGLANCVGQVSSLADKSFASNMTTGSLAALNYAAKLIQLPVSVVLVGVVPVVFSRFSKQVAEGNIVAVAQELRRTMQGLLFVLLPVTALLIVLSNQVIAFVYGRGQFDAEAVRLTGGALVYFGFGLVPLAVQPVLTRALFALGDTRTQLAATLANTLAYIGVALLAGPLLAHRGLALAFAAAQFAFAGVVITSLVRRLGKAPFAFSWQFLRTSFLAVLCCSCISWAASQLVRSTPGAILVSVSMGMVGYFSVHFAFRSEESKQVLAGVHGLGTVVFKRHAG
jgi:putative peptidoglycan lipid II flippase